MNAYQVTGRLTRDPELRSLPDGGSVCKIRLAVDGMGRRNTTGYVDVTSFGKPAEAAAKVLKQGWLVAASGRLEFAEWETTDGAKRSGHQVIGHIEFLAAPKALGEPSDAAGESPAAAADDVQF
jgi:single-strand DNA-binding protein